MSSSLFRQAAFLQSASRLAQCPEDQGAEVAFIGRSNAGKSSALNTLTENSKLARISKTPGRTQLINFFGLDDTRRLVDLPGYGYAKVPLAMKEQWQQHINDYLLQRNCLRGLVLLMDCRHPLKDLDEKILAWAIHSEVAVHILLTKADKLKRGPAQAALLHVKHAMTDTSDLISVQLFSATKKTGIPQLQAKLSGWLAAAESP